ncbi:MAG: tyrosine-type recombinase/integrase [Planctomycetota bacterium]
MKVVNRKDKPFLVLRWIDPETGKTRERQTGTRRRREAERFAADLESQLASGTLDAGEMPWDRFRVRYQDEHLAGLSSDYQGQWRTAANWLEKLHGPQLIRLKDLDASMLSRFQAGLRNEGLPATTIKSYLRPLRAALRWAERLELIAEAPRVTMPKGGKGRSKQMRSRPVTGEEFERIVAAVPRVRKHDAARWQRFLWGLWESGFRVSELLRLSWDPEGLLYVDTQHPIPLVRIYAEGHKRRNDQFQPITPEFWRLIETSPESRRGFVFSLPNRSGAQMSGKRVIRVIGDVGRAARVVTDHETGKHATSHDIGRRPFTRRLMRVLSQAEAAEWMRHQSPETTMAYYHQVKAEDLAERMWHQKGDPAGDPGVESGSSTQSGDSANAKLPKNLH